MGTNQHAPIANPDSDSIELRRNGLKVISPADCQNEAQASQATGDMALLGHEALS